MKNTLLLITLIATFHVANAQTVNFDSEDGLEAAAELYMSHPKSAPFIVLFHQAGWSRGEYEEIAPKLNKMGYNCLAVDLRSGGEVNNVRNITKQNAVKGMKETEYVHSLPDMRSAI